MEEPWITFIGSIVGSLLAIIGSLYVVYLTNKKNDKINKTNLRLNQSLELINLSSTFLTLIHEVAIVKFKYDYSKDFEKDYVKTNELKSLAVKIDLYVKLMGGNEKIHNCLKNIYNLIINFRNLLPPEDPNISVTKEDLDELNNQVISFKNYEREFEYLIENFIKNEKN